MGRRLIPLLIGGFSLRDLSGLQLWLNADRISGVDGDPVAAWPDSSGLGRDAAQGTEAARFTLKTGANGTVNGKQVARADAVDDFMQVADAAGLDGGTGMTLFVVAKQNPLAINGTLLAKANYQTDWSWALQTHTANTDEALLFVAASAGAAGSERGETTDLNRTNTAFNVLEVVYDGTQINAERVKFSRDGTPVTTSIVGTIATSLQDSGSVLNIGKFGGSLTRFFGGDYRQIAIYNRALSADERSRVRRYLGADAGLAVVA